MAHSIGSSLRAGGVPHTSTMTDEEMHASLERIEGLISQCTSGFRLSPFAIREVIGNVSTITRLSMQLTREVIARVRTLEARHVTAVEPPPRAAVRHARGH